MKTCPRCAEQVQDDAKVCRYCGHKFTGPMQVAGGIGCLAIIAMIGTCALGSREPTAPSVPPSQTSARLPDTTLKECADLLGESQKRGLVRSRPDPSRINVDELKWALLPAETKSQILAAVACDAHKVKPDDLATMDHAVAYGFRSGKRLAMLTSVGMSFE